MSEKQEPYLIKKSKKELSMEQYDEKVNEIFKEHRLNLQKRKAENEIRNNM